MREVRTACGRRYLGPTRESRREGLHRPGSPGRGRPAARTFREYEVAEISWTEDGTTRSARWHSENGTPAPERIEIKIGRAHV